LRPDFNRPSRRDGVFAAPFLIRADSRDTRLIAVRYSNCHDTAKITSCCSPILFSFQQHTMETCLPTTTVTCQDFQEDGASGQPKRQKGYRSRATQIRCSGPARRQPGPVYTGSSATVINLRIMVRKAPGPQQGLFLLQGTPFSSCPACG